MAEGWFPGSGMDLRLAAGFGSGLDVGCGCGGMGVRAVRSGACPGWRSTETVFP
jgi:hypothetical protein